LSSVACTATLLAQGFTAGNLVVLQTSGTASKASSAITLQEITTGGTAVSSVSLPSTGPRAIQTSGIFGGSEGFLSTATDGKYILLAGYGTATTYTDVTATLASSVSRVVGTVAPSGFYMAVSSSNTFYSANDIRGAVSDGTNYWASGASLASVDGINYFGPGTPAGLGTGSTPPKAYGLRIFNGQLYYSTQKSGPTNTSSQLGVFAIGTGLPTSGTVSPSQLINTGSLEAQDFSINSTSDICYVAIGKNASTGGIQKWTKSGSTWSLAYTLGTGTASIGAYGLVVDYSGSVPVLYATTLESTGNRVIKIVDNGTLPSAVVTTLVAASSGVYYKGITFAPVASGTPVVNLTVSSDTASEAGASVITVTANSSAVLTTAQTVSVLVSGTGITSGDYTLSGTTITIPAASSSASVTFTVKDDILGEGTETAVLTLRSPSSGIVLGVDSVKTITIADNDGNNFPVVKINTDSTTNYIDAGITTAPASPFVLSGVINNPTDPAATLGIAFSVTDLETASPLLTMNISSSDTSVVSLADITVSGADSIRIVKIKAHKTGYSDIKLTVSDGTDSSSYVLKFAASEDTLMAAKSLWHTGISDASAAIAIDADYYIAGDDELNLLNVYSRKNSGMPLVSYEYTSGLSLPNPSKPEVDLEAGAISYKNKGRIYWLGSMSNGKAPFDAKPNRDRIFATKISGTAAATSFTTVGYTALKTSLLSWGDANGYGFTASAAAGVDSKLPNGFAAEGMVFGPDSTTLYIALRAPLVPVTARKNALIVPIKNFETWFNDGSPSGSPAYGAPIELNLGGRGARDITRMSDGTYIIVAGNVGGGSLTGAIYKWTGKITDTAILVPAANASKLNLEGVMERSTGSTGSLQLITDNGDDELYRDGIPMKDFGDLILRKFRSVVFESLDLSIVPPATGIAAVHTGQPVRLFPNPSHGAAVLEFDAAGTETYTLTLTDLQGKKVWEQSGISEAGSNQVNIRVDAAKGMYILKLASVSANTAMKLLIE
ncbi:MAG TPA: T9SS type A sorting domain-containing protein, partial [Chitinophagaceae bacterium]|nr:T9SS type A sorting domain-containing protein [Chitinophagaceae bacterium]